MSEVFDSWQVTNLRSVAISATDGFTDGDWIEAPYITGEGIRLIQTGNIGRAEFLEKAESRKYISNSSFRLLNCKLVKPGDLLACRLADPIGRACEVPADIGDAITSVDCTIIRVDSTRFEKRFVLHWLNSEENLKRASDMAAGSTRSRISRSNLGKLPIPNPELSEQSLISKVLDTLDTAIRETETLIDKLKAVKQGLLHDLLTRGIDTNGQIRPPQSKAPQLYKKSSLGWIPREWEVEPIINLTSNSVIGPFGSDLVAADYRDSGVPVIFVRDVKPDRLVWKSNVFVSASKAQALAAHEVRAGDVVATKMGFPPCVAAVYPESMPSGIVTADIVRLRPCTDRICPDWISMFINSSAVAKQVEQITAGVTRPKVTLRDVRNLLIGLPPIKEQERVLDRLTAMQSRIQLEEASHEKLTAEKAGLMDDLLTGRVRVTPLLESAQQPAAQTGA
ncbi:restriction endonuclease subunit S [Stutzerimonas kunmingensis]|uniref:restriction endonuclease subunit S n=1 Tax=Stutzerimonas kunmingensis TaxID=1211807 RepID=UPI0028B1DAAE|nr:restriction endonuclease subunit S [Stutzerimonas kunmingensis]